MLLESRELLLCHVTGQRHWDLPKGGIHAGETPIDAALRETHEETGLRLGADALLDIGRHAYTNKKDLHLFACLSQRIDPRELHCPSTFIDRLSGRSRPEMDGFGWFGFDRIERAVHAQAGGAADAPARSRGRRRAARRRPPRAARRVARKAGADFG